MDPFYLNTPGYKSHYLLHNALLKGTVNRISSTSSEI